MADYSMIGPFVLFKEVESDELGRLYRAREVDRDGWRRTVWLRVFQAAGVQVEALRERMALVNELSSQLKAANVVSGQELTIVDGTPVLAWDHVPGNLLSRLLATTREEGFPVPTDNALLIIEKIALALASGLAFELEGQSLIHGFLHPAMIMVTNEGEAQVSGFGFAEQLLGILDDPVARERCAPYLAPEVLQARSTTKRGDVYSLGAILFELLTGQPLPADPAARAEAVANARMALEDEPIPDDIAALLKRSLADRPEERFSSAADFKKELDKLLFGGAYSPTTFNLALFIDRLFRADIEQEEKERMAEQDLDPAPYLAPGPEDEEEETELAVAKARSRAGMWIALAAALVLVAVALVVLAPKFRQPAAPPTPTPEELARKKEAEQKRFEALVQEELQRLIAEREAQSQKELEQRQKEIESLKKKLKTVQKPQGKQTMTAEQKRQEEAIREQLAQAEAAKKAQEAKLEEARQKALEEARRKAEAKAAQAATPTPVPKAAPTGAPAAAPTEAPKVAAAASPAPEAAAPASAATATEQITEGMYVPPTELDTSPAVLRTEAPHWSRMALNSRRRGVVILSARVDAEGRVTAVKILRADDKGFGIPKAAAEAVKKYLFKPGTKNGVKVTTDTTVAIPYSFRGR